MAKEQSFLKKHSILTMLLGLALVVIGIVVISKKAQLVTIVLSVALIVSGLASLRTVMVVKFSSKEWRLASIFKGIISILLGVIALFYRTETSNVIMYLMGAQMAVSGIIALCDAIVLKKDGFSPLGTIIIDALFSLAVAVVLFLFPTFFSSAIGLIVGLILIVAGLGLTVWGFLIRKADKQFVEAESEVID